MSQHPKNKIDSEQGLVSKDSKGFSQGEDQADTAGSADQILREMQDEIAPEATPLWLFVNDNAPKIAAIVVSLVILIAGVAFYQGYQESAFEDAKNKLSLLISTEDDEARLSALEAFKDEVPAKLLVALELEIAETAVLVGDFAKAQAAFSYVKQEEGESPLGVSAAINLANILNRQGEKEKALAMYESVIEQVPAQFRVALYADIAGLALSLDMKEKALEAYKSALSLLPKNDSTFQDAEYFTFKIKQLS